MTFYLSQKCILLEGCEKTIFFCKRINDLFDALNRKSPNEGLTPNNKDFKVLEDFLDWLNRWELTARKGDITYDEFLTQETTHGLRIFIQSTMELCHYLIEKFQFQYLLTGKVNQDNLEIQICKEIISIFYEFSTYLLFTYSRNFLAPYVKPRAATTIQAVQILTAVQIAVSIQHNQATKIWQLYSFGRDIATNSRVSERT